MGIAMKDLTGEVFGKLTVIALHGTRPYPGGGDGVTMAAKQWANKSGIPYTTLLHRLNQGWLDERAVQP
jgi:hypothetical protein